MTGGSQPFSEGELYAALRFQLSDPEARALAKELTSEDSTDYEYLGIPAPDPAEVCHMLPEELLILLSLVSDDLNAKVHRFRSRVVRSTVALSPIEWDRRPNEIREELIRQGKLPPSP